MSSLLVVIQTATERAPVFRLAKGALEAEATRRGLSLELMAETEIDPVAAWRTSGRTADAVILSAVTAPAQPADSGVPVIATSLARLARETRSVVGQLFPGDAAASTNDFARSGGTSEAEPPAQSAFAGEGGATTKAAPATKYLVGVTSCPTGIAHTFMAAEALLRGAKALGYEMKVETRGSVGAKNELTEEEIARADAVIVAADANVETARFAGKRLLETGTKAAINDAAGLIKEALALEPVAAKPGALKMPPKKARTGVYKHLMTGVSHMLPLIVAGGLLIALAFAIGGVYAGDQEGTFGWALMQIGAKSAFALFIPVLAGFIAFSIADRPGLTPGLIGGMLAVQVGSGFLGGLVAGFLAGYIALWINRAVRLPDSLAGLKPVLILPLLSSLLVGLAMIYVVGPPVKVVLETLSAWLSNMQEGSALTLGLILGAMMAFDMGGPVNKAAYTFGIGLLSAEIYGPMAAVMAAGMVPPLACAVAANIARNRFTSDERQASKATAVLGLSFITEGAIPYAAADPIRVIPCIMAGSAVTGGLSMLFGCELVVPHGGIFVLLIPNAITHGLAYLGAIVAGTLVSTVVLCLVKRPLAQAGKDNKKSSASVVKPAAA
ncbi:MAG: fructose-specific PTS transporter subunit EIIC [Verrucomicrobiota bacterium JB024]|nr:fructose-specific PTS transporter subunit EIIC [Verrucomicrobiota bacterium JB024]